MHTPPIINGIPNEDVWRLAEPATDFIQRDPHEGEAESERSEIRVLYGDNEIESDRASIRIDSYHDHPTAYEFTFNAGG